jgi:hypothetical protein
MAHQDKQDGIGEREGFPCNSVELVLLANGNRYAVDSNTFSLSGKALSVSITNLALSQL